MSLIRSWTLLGPWGPPKRLESHPQSLSGCQGSFKVPSYPSEVNNCCITQEYTVCHNFIQILFLSPSFKYKFKYKGCKMLPFRGGDIRLYSYISVPWLMNLIPSVLLLLFRMLSNQDLDWKRSAGLLYFIVSWISGELSEQVKICFLGSTLPPGQISAIFPPVWSRLWLPHRWCFLQPVKRLWALCSGSTLICVWFKGVRCKCGYYPQESYTNHDWEQIFD